MLTAALVIAGWVAAYLSLREVLKRRYEDLRREFQDQINTLHARIRLLDHAVAARPAAVPASEPVPREETGSQAVRRAEPIAWPALAIAPEAAEEVSPETMAVIAETVTGFLGKRVRIRSAKKLPAPPPPAAQTSSASGDPWAQQGRVLVQTSHESIQARTSGTPAPPEPSSLRGVVLENTDFS
jgi:hypothetical protein